MSGVMHAGCSVKHKQTNEEHNEHLETQAKAINLKECHEDYSFAQRPPPQRFSTEALETFAE